MDFLSITLNLDPFWNKNRLQNDPFWNKNRLQNDPFNGSFCNLLKCEKR